MRENLLETYKAEILRLREVCWHLEERQFEAITKLGGSNSGGYLIGRMLVKADYLAGKDLPV